MHPRPLLLRIPVLGDVMRYAAIERFCRIIGAMLKAGVPLPEAMQAAIDSVNNKVFEGKLETVHEAHARGRGHRRADLGDRDLPASRRSR